MVDDGIQAHSNGSHVLESMSVLLLALAIADKEFVAREPVGVLLQQQQQQGQQPLLFGELRWRAQRPRPWPPSEAVLEAMAEAVEDTDVAPLAQELSKDARWPLVLAGCCPDADGKKELQQDNRPETQDAPPPVPPLEAPIGSYVIASMLATLPAMMATAAEQPFWNPTARFLILLLDEYSDEGVTHDRVHEAVNLLWNNYDVSRLVIVDTLRVYSWAAYAMPFMCVDTSTPTFVADARAEAFPEGVLYPPTRFEGSKHVMMLSDCPLKYSGAPWPPFVLNPAVKLKADQGFEHGVDLNMLRAFIRHKHMRLRFVPMPSADKEYRWGTLLENGSWTGLLGMLQARDVDVVIGGFHYLPDPVGAFFSTVPYINEAMMWFVPRPRPVPAWQLLYNVIARRGSTGGFFVLVISLPVVLAMQYMHHLNEQQQQRNRRSKHPKQHPHQKQHPYHRHQQLQQHNKQPPPPPPPPLKHQQQGVETAKEFLSLFAMAFEQPPLVFPRATAPRLYAFLFCVFFFHFNIVFRTAITNVLASRPFQPSLRTRYDLLKYGFEVGTPSFEPAAEMLLGASDMEAFRSIHNKCELSSCLVRLQERNEKYGLLFSSSIMEYLTPLYFLDSSGAPFVERLQESALPMFVTMYLRKGDPLAWAVDEVFRRLVQAGLPDHWLHRVSTFNGMQARRSAADKDGDGIPDEDGAVAVLTLDHIGGALLALSFGHILAVIVFLGEVVAALGLFVSRHLSVSVSWRSTTTTTTTTTTSETSPMNHGIVGGDVPPTALCWKQLAAGHRDTSSPPFDLMMA